MGLFVGANVSKVSLEMYIYMHGCIYGCNIVRIKFAKYHMKRALTPVDDCPLLASLRFSASLPSVAGTVIEIIAIFWTMAMMVAMTMVSRCRRWSRCRYCCFCCFSLNRFFSRFVFLNKEKKKEKWNENGIGEGAGPNDETRFSFVKTIFRVSFLRFFYLGQLLFPLPLFTTKLLSSGMYIWNCSHTTPRHATHHTRRMIKSRGEKGTEKITHTHTHFLTKRWIKKESIVKCKLTFKRNETKWNETQGF